MTEEYKQNYEKGFKYQDFVVEQLYNIGLPIISYSSKEYQCSIGENRNGIEIKFDDRINETGNIYIETSEKSNANNPEFVPSGIYRIDNTWLYIIGNYNIMYILGKQLLQHIFERKQYEKMGGRYVETPTSKGYVISAKYAERELSLKTIRIGGPKCPY